MAQQKLAQQQLAQQQLAQQQLAQQQLAQQQLAQQQLLAQQNSAATVVSVQQQKQVLKSQKSISPPIVNGSISGNMSVQAHLQTQSNVLVSYIIFLIFFFSETHCHNIIIAEPFARINAYQRLPGNQCSCHDFNEFGAAI